MFLAAEFHDEARAPEIVAGVFRESQIVTLAGNLNTGKTPLLKDWAVAIAAGLPWCGCATSQRPVIILDFESDKGDFLRGLRDIAEKRGLLTTPLPIDAYIRRGRVTDPTCHEIQNMLDGNLESRFRWLEGKLRAQPNALFVMDPIQLFANIDRNDFKAVTTFFTMFRNLQVTYPQATWVFVYNIRKDDPTRKEPPNLLENVQGWLQEISGSMDLQNRSDVRLGMQFMNRNDRDVVVLNGLRRGEVMEPFILETAYLPLRDCDNSPREGGFARVPAQGVKADRVLSGKMYEAWLAMDSQFSIHDLLKICTTGTAYRLAERAVKLGLSRELERGVFEKL